MESISRRQFFWEKLCISLISNYTNCLTAFCSNMYIQILSSISQAYGLSKNSLLCIVNQEVAIDRWDIGLKLANRPFSIITYIKILKKLRSNTFDEEVLPVTCQSSKQVEKTLSPSAEHPRISSYITDSAKKRIITNLNALLEVTIWGGPDFFAASVLIVSPLQAYKDSRKQDPVTLPRTPLTCMIRVPW